MRVTGELAGAGWLSQGILASGYDGIPVLLPLVVFLQQKNKNNLKFRFLIVPVKSGHKVAGRRGHPQVAMSG